MKLTFKEKDFDTFRKFEDAVKGQLGGNTYVGTNSATVPVNYSPKLADMLRPFCKEWPSEFELKVLVCERCKKVQPFLCSPGEETYLCFDCVGKNKKKTNNEA